MECIPTRCSLHSYISHIIKW